MILVDKDIKQLISNGAFTSIEKSRQKQTAIYDGNNDCVKNIGYDLRTASFCYHGKMVETVELRPGESVFVQSQETIVFDSSTIGKVILKNSRIRMGLTMDAPIYQPGHITNIYFRITNISSNIITLSRGEKYVMLIFEQLDNDPDTPYSGAFQKEFSFMGLADYKSAYMEQIQSLDGKVSDIHDIEKRIYTTVITIMTVLIAVFTLLNVNTSLASSTASSIDFIKYNLVTLGAVSFLALLMDELINRQTSKNHKLWWIPAMCFFVVIALIVFGYIIGKPM